jgi:hypothetical protein
VWFETGKKFSMSIGVGNRDIPWDVSFGGIVPSVPAPNKIDEVPAALIDTQGTSGSSKTAFLVTNKALHIADNVNARGINRLAGVDEVGVIDKGIAENGDKHQR